MRSVTNERMTHRHTGELVIFHIGMQINRWWRLDRWLPVFFAVPGMLRELSHDCDSGFLGYSLLFGSGGPYVVQYWSSADKLYAYAKDQSGLHRPAWAKFNQMARNAPGTVGIWHETFLIERAESIYVGTKPMGLGKATELIPVSHNRDSAQQRLADGRTAYGPTTDPDSQS